ncbi:hypothetical protein Tco_0941623 [Tanacetum coccineum]|uniref:Xylulose kinase-1 n=1 Tax=Tanacetum coccineum TaxID=301880 RepID=A0ABQ5DU55_9ASTR
MSANDNFSLHDEEELSLHDDASLDGSVPATNKGDAPAKPPQIHSQTLNCLVLPPTTQEEPFTDEKERKSKQLLLMLVPKDHSDIFMAWIMPKEIWAAITTRFGGNAKLEEKAKSCFMKQQMKTKIISFESLPPTWDSLAMTMRTKKNNDHNLPTPATPGLADEVIHSFLATNADNVDLIHEDLDQIDDLDLEEMDKYRQML